jgi:hypothetical protein
MAPAYRKRLLWLASPGGPILLGHCFQQFLAWWKGQPSQ